MAKQSIGEFLATLRKAHGYTQQEVADKLDISNRTLSAWERGNALPDILILPALAELYGVTADEILAGERKPSGETPELSKKAESKLYKKKLATFTMQAYILGGIFCLGLLLLFIGWYVDFTTGAWVGWEWWLLLLFLGLAAAVVSAVTLIAFWKSAEASVDEDDEKSGTFCILLRRRVSVCAYLGAALAFLFVPVSLFSAFMSFGPIVVLGGVFLILALVLLFGGSAIYRRALRKWGGEEVRARLKKEGKRWEKVALFGLIPVGLAIALMIMFTYWNPVGYRDRYADDDRAAFTEHMETMIIDGLIVDRDGESLAPQPGAYYLGLSQLAKTAEPQIKYDLGNGFSCIFGDDFEVCAVYFERSYYYVHRYTTTDGSFSVYDVYYLRYPEARPTDFAYFGGYELQLRGNGAALVEKFIYDYSELFYFVGVAVILLDVFVCIGIGALLREKKIRVKL